MKTRILNYILYALGIFIAGSGFILKWKIPHGPTGKNVNLWGFDKHDWKDFHLWSGILITILVIWHLWLHRKWLINVACKKDQRKLLVGLLSPIILIGAIVVTPLSQAPSGQGGCGNCDNQSSCSSSASHSSNHCGNATRKNSCIKKVKPEACPSGSCQSSCN